ncbi:hypothetical protein LWM68_20205 [Niabella sp. W65]|nr:hypothetical protein [Niabella sp. W65]MCH7364879.1 hypothetical protein [Niabella sp. W65]
MKRTSVILTGILLLSMSIAYGQETELPLPSGDGQMIPSVVGNSSISNIDQPNLFDGSTTIGVPIYNYSNNYGSYGVSLTYNTKGIKVDQIASAAGLNWDIAAGGSIYRVLRHLPDETFEAVGIAYEGDSDTLNSMGKLAYSLSSYTDPGQHSDANTDVYFDDAFDDFVVSLPGMGFTFNIGKNGFLFTHPKKQVTVDLLLDGAPVDTIPVASSGTMPGELGFIITDDQGIRYHFEKSAYASTGGYIQSWHLSRIVFPDLSEIRYYYRNDIYDTDVLVIAIQNQSVNNYNDGTVGGYHTYDYEVEGNSKLPSLPDSIVYPNNVTVSFRYKDYSGAGTGYYRCDFPGGPVLDEIRVRSSKRVLRYKLNQSYVQSGTGDVFSKDLPCADMTSLPLGHQKDWYFRLFLTRIFISNADDSKTELYYSFDYNNIILPHRLSGAKDFFGYYNGNTMPTGYLTQSIPRHKNVFGSGSDSFGVYRQYNAAYAKAGLLYRVKNVYGGIKEYSYEGHVLANSNIIAPSVSDHKFHGRGVPDGVRLKETVQYDAADPSRKIYTRYTYEGGISFIPGGYFHAPRKVNTTTGAIVDYFMLNNFISAHHLINGSNHGYSKVTTETRNSGNELLSKSMIRFTNIVDSSGTPKARYTLVGSNKHYYQRPYADRQYLRDWEIGLPIEMSEYDHNNRLISRTNNDYTFSIDSVSTLGKVENKVYYRGRGWDEYNGYNDVVPLLDSASYRPYTGKALLQKTIYKKYVTDASIIHDTAYYSYDIRDNLSTVTTRNSQDEQLLTRNIYNYQVGNPPFHWQPFLTPGIEDRHRDLEDQPVGTFLRCADQCFHR